MNKFAKILSGGDLRSIGKGHSVILTIQNQNDFDELFKCLFHQDRIVVMRVADAIEKITINHRTFLKTHKNEILALSDSSNDKELKWHLALLIPRLPLDSKEFSKAWNTLSIWAMDKTNSRIVRVNSIQSLFEMKEQKRELEKDYNSILSQIEMENIPSINARIRKLKNVSR